MKRNVLSENMQRFGTKNLKEQEDFINPGNPADKANEKEEYLKNVGMPRHMKSEEILDLVSRAEDMVQNLRSNMSTNSVLQREEKMGYLNAYNELLDLLGDIGFQAEIEL